MRKKREKLRGRPLAIDLSAASSSQSEPAFISPPPGAPAYHGFPVLSDVTAEGFTLGKITDFELESCSEGDAFVVAPDGGRAGLVWEISDKPRFREVCPPDSKRWGVWEVTFPHAMTSREDALRNLKSVLPELKKRWETWRQPPNTRS